MPYIPQERRVITEAPSNAGELNFHITTLIDQYLSHHGLRYQTMNDILGALEGAKLEFYRRVAAPYEIRKCNENGDVYAAENADVYASRFLPAHGVGE